MTDLGHLAVFLGALLGIVGTGELVCARRGWRPEASRRLVHLLTGLAVAVAIPFFETPWPLYGLAAAFAVVNLVSVTKGWFPGMHGIRRESWGTVTFPLALLFALVACWTLDAGRTYIIQIAFVVLAVADPLAATMGETLRRPGWYRVGRNTRSLAGSGAFFLAAWILMVVTLLLGAGNRLGPGEVVLAALVTAALATLAEALATRGWDNFFIVVAVVAPLAWLHQFPETLPVLVLAAGIAAAFGVAVYHVRFLTLDGTLAASAFAFFVVGVGGWAWAAPAFTFFVLSSVLSKVGRRRKQTAEGLAEKGSTRDAGQVYANGGVAWLLVVFYVLFPDEVVLYWAFAGALAAAAADTWATEIGTFVGGTTRLFWSGRQVPPGTSGGVSLAGTLGAVAGAAAVFGSLVPFTADLAGEPGVRLAALLVVGGGFAASLVDSLIGATAQALYRDPAGLLTERPQKGAATSPVRGFRAVTNDRVNLACTVVGALVPFATLLLR